MFVWMSGFENPLIHTNFNMFVASANESPAFQRYILNANFLQGLKTCIM